MKTRSYCGMYLTYHASKPASHNTNTGFLHRSATHTTQPTQAQRILGVVAVPGA